MSGRDAFDEVVSRAGEQQSARADVASHLTEDGVLTTDEREALAEAVVGKFIDHPRHNPAHGLGVFDRSRCDRIVAPAVERILAARAQRQAVAERTKWERAVLRELVALASEATANEIPDFLHAASTAMIRARVVVSSDAEAGGAS